MDCISPMDKMKFPRLPEKLDRRKKLFVKDIREIRRKRKGGATLTSLAAEYHVNPWTIRYHCLSRKKKKEVLSRISDYEKRVYQMKKDKRERNSTQIKSLKRIFTEFPDRRIWHNGLCLKRYHEKKWLKEQ